MIAGRADDAFAGVRDVAAAVLAGQGGGLAVAAVHRGRLVCDLWGGTVGERGLVHTWSVVKPVTAACLHVAAARAGLGLDTPVARVWPGLRAGRDGLTLAGVLAHRAGLAPVPGGDVAGLLDVDATCARLAAAAPDWPPGTAGGEHALTYGHLVGELVRRIDGRRLPQVLREELAGPHGLEVHVGVPGHAMPDVAPLEGADAAWWAGLAGPPGTLRHAAFGTGMSPGLVNGAAWRRGDVAAVNGHATARGMARFWALVLDGTLPAALLAPAPAGPDPVLGRRVAWTLGSAQLDPDEAGMGGAGGSYAGARPGSGLAWAFLTTVMGGFTRAERIESALLRAAAGRGT